MKFAYPSGAIGASRKILSFLVLDGLSKVLMLVVGVALARFMAKEEYAWYTIANSMLGGMAMLTTLGVSVALTSEGGKAFEDKKRLGTLVATCRKYRFVFAAVFVPFILAATAFMLQRTGAGWPYIVVLSALLLLFLAVQINQDIAASIIKLAGRYSFIPRIETGVGIVRLILIGLLIACSLVKTWAVLAATVVVQAVAYFAFVAKAAAPYYDSSRAPSEADGRRIRSITYNTFPETLKAFVMPQLSVFILASFANASSVADVGALGRLALLYIIPTGLFGGIFQPWLARANRQEVVVRFGLIVLFGASVGCILFAFFWAAGPLLLAILGPGYSGLTTELLIMSGSRSIDLIFAAVLSLLVARGLVSRIWLIPLTTSVATLACLPLFDLSSLAQVLWIDYVRFAPMLICCLYLVPRALKSAVAGEWPSSGARFGGEADGTGPNLIFYRGVDNFGDLVNEVYWPKAIGRVQNRNGAPSLLGIGSIINDEHLRLGTESGIVIAGSGAGYGEISTMPSDLRVAFVRGPLTCKKLGIREEFGVGDPAYIAEEVLELQALRQKAVRRGIAFVPHFESQYFYRWDWVCTLAGVKFVSPVEPFADVFSNIASSELVITESLHGAILADALRVPFIPVKTRPEINEFKWADFFASLDIDGSLLALETPAPGRTGLLKPKSLIESRNHLREIAQQGSILSSDSNCKRMKDGLVSKIRLLREAYHEGVFVSIPRLEECRS